MEGLTERPKLSNHASHTSFEVSERRRTVRIHCDDGTVETDTVVLGGSSVVRGVDAEDHPCSCGDTRSAEADAALGLLSGREGADLAVQSDAVGKNVLRRLMGYARPPSEESPERVASLPEEMCKLCFSKFTVSLELANHLQDVHGIRQYGFNGAPPDRTEIQEPHRGTTFQTAHQGIVRIAHSQVPMSEQETGNPDVGGSVYEDSQSSIRFSEESDIFSESEDEDGESSDEARDETAANEFGCFKCSKTAKSVTHLKWHLAWAHFKKEIMSKFGIVKSSRACPSCFETLSHTMMILRHLASKHDALEGIISKSDMDKMMKTYPGKKCQVCHLKFSIGFNLTEHLDVVHGIKQTKKNLNPIEEPPQILNLAIMSDPCDTHERPPEVERVASVSVNKEDACSILEQSGDWQSSVPYSEQSSPLEEMDSESVDESYGNEYDEQESSSSDDGDELDDSSSRKTESVDLAMFAIPKRCYICDKVFKHVSVLNNHLAADHFSKMIEKKSYKCTRECPKYYLTGLDKIFHLGFTHRVLKSCVPVEHYTESRSLKKKSHLTPVPRGGSQCKYCSRIFPGRLGSHTKYCKKKSNAMPVDREIPTGLACFKCSKIAMSATHLKWHLAWTHFRKEIMAKFSFSKNTRTCTVCYKPLARSMMAFRHLTSKHNALEGLVSKEILDNMMKTSYKK